MAATVAIRYPQYQAFTMARARLVTVTFGASDYPSHGYSITPNSLGLAEIFGAIVVSTNKATDPGNAAFFLYDSATKKLVAYGTAGSATGLTEIANGADLSDHTVVLLVFGV